MKTKTPIKILTLSLFVMLIIGCILYKGGYIFSKENKMNVVFQGQSKKLKMVASKDYALNVFEHLKLVVAKPPTDFDTLYTEPDVSDTRFLASSKSLVMTDFHFPFSDMFTESLDLQLKEQFHSAPPSKN